MHHPLDKTTKEVALDPRKALSSSFRRSSDYFSAVNILKEPFVLDLV